MTARTARFICLLYAVLVVSAGAVWIWPPAGLIVSGLCVAAVSFLLED